LCPTSSSLGRVDLMGVVPGLRNLAAQNRLAIGQLNPLLAVDGGGWSASSGRPEFPPEKAAERKARPDRRDEVQARTSRSSWWSMRSMSPATHRLPARTCWGCPGSLPKGVYLIVSAAPPSDVAPGGRGPGPAGSWSRLQGARRNANTGRHAAVSWREPPTWPGTGARAWAEGVTGRRQFCRDPCWRSAGGCGSTSTSCCWRSKAGAGRFAAEAWTTCPKDSGSTTARSSGRDGRRGARCRVGTTSHLPLLSTLAGRGGERWAGILVQTWPEWVEQPPALGRLPSQTEWPSYHLGRDRGRRAGGPERTDSITPASATSSRTAFDPTILNESDRVFTEELAEANTAGRMGGLPTVFITRPGEGVGGRLCRPCERESLAKVVERYGPAAPGGHLEGAGSRG